jgi:hypothetical protein
MYCSERVSCELISNTIRVVDKVKVKKQVMPVCYCCDEKTGLDDWKSKGFTDNSGWKKAQVHANLRHLSLATQTCYYTGLGNIEPNKNASHWNKIQETKTSHKTRMFCTLLKGQALSYFEHHLMRRLEAEDSDVPDNELIELVLRDVGLEYNPKRTICVQKY